MKKLVSGLQLLIQKIDVCVHGCMLYWYEDSVRKQCKFFGRTQYKIRRRKKGKNKPLEEKLVKTKFYFSLTPRLQISYATKRTTKHTGYHCENS